jgi:hypothetical protein
MSFSLVLAALIHSYIAWLLSFEILHWQGSKSMLG